MSKIKKYICEDDFSCFRCNSKDLAVIDAVKPFYVLRSIIEVLTFDIRSSNPSASAN